jgi:hypothetical protein
LPTVLARTMSGISAFFIRRGWRPAVAVAYAAVVGVFLCALAQFYIPGKGFTYLIAFGGRDGASRVTAMNGLNYYALRDSDGYDGQYYAQIAMTPDLKDPQLGQAVDGVPYRARRILFSWTAFALGFGQPAWILQVYALQNALCWLALAIILLRWFPPDGWSNLLRWAGVLFSFGMCVSVHNALIDGPSLLLVALGVWAVERNRAWLATAVFALVGLAKETNLLGAAALGRPEEGGARTWRALAVRALLIATPLALWLLYIQQRHFGSAVDLGARNFDWPLFAYGRKWAAVLRELARPDGDGGARWSLLMLLALTAQFLFLALRPQPGATWWRVGAPFAVLMLVLGDAVWEGFPGAASRVLLPMQLAFNVLVPRGRAWTIVLVLGNLTLFNAVDALEPPKGDGYQVDGPGALVIAPSGAQACVEFDAAWFPIEGGRNNTWRWSQGDGTIVIVNPQSFPVEAHVRLTLRAITPRTAWVRHNGNELWQGAVNATPLPIEFPPLTLEPGRNVLEFKSDQPAARPSSGDIRALALCIKNLTVELRRSATAK